MVQDFETLENCKQELLNTTYVHMGELKILNIVKILS